MSATMDVPSAEADVLDDYNSSYVYWNDSGHDSNRPGPMPPSMPPMADLYILKKYVLPITILIGIFGNLVVIYIFTRTKLKKPSSSRYLAAVAAADTGFLCTTLLVRAELLYNIQITTRVGLCQLTVFGNHVFTFLSAWYLSAVIIEKYVGVYWPRKKARMCTVFRAKCVIISLAIVGLVSYLYLTYFFGVYETKYHTNTCNIWIDDDIRTAWEILSRMDAIVNFAIPYIIMFFLSCLVAHKSWQYHKQSTSAGERFLRRQRVTTAQDKDFKTTPMLLLLVLCTIVLCTPNNTTSVRRVFQKTVMAPSFTEIRIYTVFHYMSVLNNCIKLFVYMVSSHAFLKEFRNMFCCFRKILQYARRTSSNELHGLGRDGPLNQTKTVATSTEGIV